MSGGDAQCEIMVQVCWNASSKCFSGQHRHLVDNALLYVANVAGGGAVWRRLLSSTTRAASVGLLVCLWVCYYDNSNLRASIFTKLGL